ncbi:BTAD domain-containing putative transcriptional regulator [Nonomuraea sp. NPDC050643]|uniref:AfsR/SARP family transcriptional regulator n=1 Tax=Nonomuraea sp. NPDC050643 TaxID=3155660 RepID=UPI0033D2AAA2
MEFRVLGPVEIWRDGRNVPIVGEKLRTLLAILVLRAGQVVRHDELAHALWGERPPATGRRALHSQLWSLRRLLTQESALSTSSGGYALHVPDRGSDLAVFRAAVAAAQVARSMGDVAQAAQELRSALVLWRGPALGGTRPEFQLVEGHPLEELRLAALTDRIDADLALGRHAELIGELRQATAAAPLHERLRGQLMLALYRDGRRAEALEQYTLARRCFRDELGLEPGDELARLQRAVLDGDPELLGEGRATPAGSPRQVPRQLPADVPRFTGRGKDLGTLDTLLGSVLVISAIAGTAGVGKTALATHWAQSRTERFPDGQVYLDLHGYSPRSPVAPGQALERLLRVLGVPAGEIPHDVDERAALYRSLLSGREMLIFLDNAATADQVRPLLPGSSPSRVLITSRDSLRGLAATHDVGFVELDVLTAEEAEALLHALLGGGQAPGPISALAALCGHLPLALRLAAAHLHATREPAAALVARMRAGGRLEALHFTEDPHVGVRAAFALSYRALPLVTRLVFRIASLHPGGAVGLDALAAMTELSAPATHQAVAELVRAHLVQLDEHGLIVMHDLVREYARERAAAEDDELDAVTRLLDWQAHTARAAMGFIDPDAKLLRPSVDQPAVTREFGDRESALAWLNVEHHNSVALIAYASRHGRPAHAWQLAYIMAYHFYQAGHIDDWLATQRTALDAVRDVGDVRGEAMVLTTLGHALMATDQYGDFLTCQRRAAELAQVAGDRRMHAEALYYVAHGLYRTGELADALEVNEQARLLYVEQGDEAGRLAALYAEGMIDIRLGKMRHALECLDIVLPSLRERERRHDEAYLLIDMGMAHAGLDDLAAAASCHEQALRIAREFGDRLMEADALCHVGHIAMRSGDFEAAIRHQEEALAHARRLPSRLIESRVLNGLGETHSARGDQERARRCWTDALEIALRIKDPYEAETARTGLAHLP